MYLAKTKVMVVAVVADAQVAAVTVKAVVARVVAIKAILLMLVVVQATAHRLVNALAMTAVIKVSHVIHLVNQMSVQVASRIKASALVLLAVVIAMAFHVASVLQRVVVVQVAAKVAQLVVVKVAQAVATVVTTRNTAINNG